MSARVVVVVLLVVAAAVAPAARAAGPPLPEPNALVPVTAGPCTPDADNPYEQATYHADQWYGAACHRLHFTYGPIPIRPGQNDVVISPITIEKPLFDGYLTRFRPNLVRADGTVPPIEQIHLHHAVWFNVAGAGFGNGFQAGPLDERSYGDGPFFAAGEEKTIFDLPQGYGMPVKGSDQWNLLYMVHNQVASPDQVWITYDIDYVAASDAAAASMHPAYPIWLDVRKGNFYPVFNVQRGYGTAGTCTWPNEQCAAFDPFGQTSLGQGSSGNGVGTSWTLPDAGRPLGRVPSFDGGTLVAIGGHLHPGGVSDNIDLERAGAGRTRIFTSEARYWDWSDPSVVGGPPTSWDLSMTATGKPRWGVRVEPGDTFWISATYDAQVQSSYEDMGIAIVFLAPDDTTGVDPFAVAHDTSPDCTSGGLAASPPTLCERGVVTHGHMAEANNHGGPNPPNTGTPPATGQPVNRIDIVGFSYLPGNQGTEATTGIPVVQHGQPLTFQNEDAAIDVYHSITSCEYPCTGPTGIAYPLANGASSQGGAVDFDSAELGYGPSFGGNSLGAAKNTSSWTLDTTTLQPGAVYTFFCRIHPSMRGEFAVSQ